MARRYGGRPEANLVARRLLAPYGQGERDPEGAWLPGALLSYARTLVLIPEPAGPDRPGEVLTSPWLTALLGAGDCDDVATLQATLAVAVGLGAWIGRLSMGPRFAHILCAVSPSRSQASPRLMVDPEMERPTDAREIPGARWLKVRPNADLKSHPE